MAPISNATDAGGESLARRLDGVCTICESVADQADDIQGLLRLLGWRKPNASYA